MARGFYCPADYYCQGGSSLPLLGPFSFNMTNSSNTTWSSNGTTTPVEVFAGLNSTNASSNTTTSLGSGNSTSPPLQTSSCGSGQSSQPPGSPGGGACEWPGLTWDYIISVRRPKPGEASWTGGLGNLRTNEVNVWVCMLCQFNHSTCPSPPNLACYTYNETSKQFTYWGSRASLDKPVRVLGID